MFEKIIYYCLICFFIFLGTGDVRASGFNLCDLPVSTPEVGSPATIANVTFTNETTCTRCAPCFVCQPVVTYTNTGSGCDDVQGQITVTVEPPPTGNGSSCDNFKIGNFYYRKIGDAYTSQSLVQNGTTYTTTIAGLSSGNYEAYISYGVTYGIITADVCLTEPTTITITKPNCCTGNADPNFPNISMTFDGTVTPVYTANLSTQQLEWLGGIAGPTATVAINGTFIVNSLLTNTTQNFKIGNTTIVFNENARIDVEDLFGLDIKGSTLQTCGDFMWQGITLKGAQSYLDAESSIIRDAQYTIYTNNGAEFRAKNVQFENDNVGIDIENGGPAYFAPVGNCTFSNPALHLKAPMQNQRTEIGIVAFNTQYWQIGENTGQGPSTNHFTGITCGILGINSNLTVYDNYFEAIKNYHNQLINPQNGNYPNYKGCAIYADAFWGFEPGFLWVRTSNQIPHDGSPQETNFKNCDNAIMANHTHLMAVWNNIVDCKNGIRANFGNERSISVYRNLFWHTLFPVTLANNQNCYTNISYNFMHNASQYAAYPNTMVTDNTYGILIAESQINSMNTVYNNTIFGATKGVSMRGTNVSTNIEHNHIYTGSLFDVQIGHSRRIGIAVENSNGTAIYDNTITGNSSQWQGGLIGDASGLSNNRQIGIFANRSPNLTISCNAIGYFYDLFNNQQAAPIGRGMCFRQNCSSDEIDRIRENVMDNCFVNLYLERLGGAQAVIGLQNPNDITESDLGEATYVNRNSFKQNTSGFHTYNYMPICSNCNAVIPSFFYRVGVDPYPNTNNLTNVPGMAISFRPALTNASVSTQCEGTEGNQPLHAVRGNNPLLDALKALELTNYSADEDFLKWQEQKELYQKLDMDTAYREEYNLLNSFYNQNKTGNIGKLQEAEDKLKALQKKDTAGIELRSKTIYNNIDFDNDKIKSLKEQIETARQNGYTILENTLMNNYMSLADSMKDKMAEIKALAVYGADTGKVTLEKQLRAKQHDYEKAKRTLQKDDENSFLDSTTRQSMQAEADALKNEITSLSSQLNPTGADTLAPATNLKLMEANAKLMEVYASNNYETNEKQVKQWLITIEKQGPDSLKQQDWLAIGGLAASCPLKEGYSVYTARALYASYDNTVDFEDIELCEQAGFFKKEEVEKPIPTFNPSSYLYYERKAKRAMVVYQIASDDNGEVEIYDLLGQPIAVAEISGSNRLVAIPISFAASGEYFYKIHTSQGYNSNGKFIILE